MQFQWTGIIGTDSQSLLDTINGKDVEPQAETDPIPIHGATVVLDVLCPDWDILIEIQSAKELLPAVKLQYVQGHPRQFHTVSPPRHFGPA